MVCYMKYLPDPIWQKSCLRFHNNAYTTYHDVRGNNKINGKRLNLLITCFFIHLNKQNAGVLGWPLKLLQSPYSKVWLTSSLALCPNRRIFLAFNAPSQFFLWESRKAVAWWEHCFSHIPLPSVQMITLQWGLGWTFHILPVCLSTVTTTWHRCLLGCRKDLSLFLGVLSIMPKITEILSVESQMERSVSVSSNQNILDHL